MTRRVPCGDKDFTKLEAIAVFNFLVFESVLCPAFAADINLRRFQSSAELARTAHQVGVDVRLENMGDSDARFPRHVDVNVAIRTWIEHRRDAFVIVADEIRELSDARRLDRLENERHSKI